MVRSGSRGRSRPGSVFGGAAGAGALALLAAACSSSSGQPPAAAGAAAHPRSPMPEMSSSMPMASPSMAMGGGALPAGATDMRLAITAPAPGARVTGNSVTVRVRVSGDTDTCALAGKHVMGMEAAATGHYHVLLDGSLINMFCTPAAVVSLQNVKPGTHTLTVVPALDDHAQVDASARSIRFDYAPAAPLPALAAATATGRPAIAIVAPAPGATVTGTFTVAVRITGYRNSCALFGKPNLPGWGHWHLNLDTATGGMMGMGGMLGMSCTSTIRASTAGLKPGSTHTLIALLVDNMHVPLMPLIAAQVRVRIGK